ncbi:HPr family phosphocarrier protein [Herbidospora mongoliensis]|uniref:HPr family phosphocarrier protein n=1 Tax=Herbidospora mongoliensis TaxID=688067 RepID=UPI00082AC48D|nr:HPr family phosphocarrier protein [Herbidospora mongoliensis]
MPQRRLIVEAEVGLHARPAATFVQTATKSSGSVTLAKGDGVPVNAKSILAVLALDVKKGDAVTINVDGEGADALLDELSSIAGAT